LLEGAIFFGLRHLSRHFGCKLLVIWDGGSIHRSNEVEDFLADGRSEEIHLERFPAYAPELNPDEGVWQHVNHSPATFFIEPTLTPEDTL